MDAGDIFFAVTRAGHIGCALLLTSLPLFSILVGRVGANDTGERFRRAAFACLAAALVAELLTGVAWLGFVTASMSDSPQNWPTPHELALVLTQTRFGLIWTARAAAALLLGLGLIARAVRSEGIRGHTNRADWFVLALSSLLLGSLAWAGHAGSDLRWPVVHLAVDIIHLFAAAVWPIGLVPLLIFLHGARGSVSPQSTTLGVVCTYSGCAFAAVWALVGSGVVNSWLMLPSWLSLLDSTYGQLLLAKVAVMAMMLVLGALNRYCFLPELAQGESSKIRRTVAVESILAVIVLLIVGLMGLASPGT